jgi:hypothetical protein
MTSITTLRLTSSILIMRTSRTTTSLRLQMWKTARPMISRASTYIMNKVTPNAMQRHTTSSTSPFLSCQLCHLHTPFLPHSAKKSLPLSATVHTPNQRISTILAHLTSISSTHFCAFSWFRHSMRLTCIGEQPYEWVEQDNSLSKKGNQGTWMFNGL